MEREMADQPNFREALGEAVTAMFSALVALKAGEIAAATKEVLEAAHERGGEMLIVRPE